MSTFFEDIYRRYSEDLLRFTLWLSGNRADAEEIAAEAFLRLWTCRDELRAATVKGYLLTIARNVHSSRRRKARRFEPLPLTDLYSRDPSPDRQVELADSVKQLMDSVQKLPDGEREAFLLRVQQNLEYEEIARCLGISPTAAKVRTHRARMKIAAIHPSWGEKT